MLETYVTAHPQLPHLMERVNDHLFRLQSIEHAQVEAIGYTVGLTTRAVGELGIETVELFLGWIVFRRPAT